MSLHGPCYIREAFPEDLPQVREVLSKAFTPIHAIYRFTGATLANQEERFHKGVRLVALSGEYIVGTMQYRCDAQHVHLLALGVAPAHQRHGIARAMIEHVARLSPALGHTRLALDTIAEAGNVSVFERMGFRTIRTEFARDCISDHYADLHLVTMERELHPTT